MGSPCRWGAGGIPITEPSANPVKPRPPATRLRALDGDRAPDARRFSPLNAPQRAAVEAFCAEAAGWAQRQARRSYGHLSDDLRQQAIDRAMRELKLGAPPAVDRRTLYDTLAEELTHQLRQAHSGWCLNAAEAEWRREGPVAVAAEDDARATAAAVGSFVDTGLGGLERAVLQLEIGAARETRTARAALRLGARDYARHRTEGLSKLRSAIDAHERGRVCDDHRDAVVLAATGDATALHGLSSGDGRCRSCAREAAGLRRVLQQRLCVAPWPLAIKPAGVLVAKLGFLGAVFGGKAGSTTGLGALAGSGPFSTSGALAIIATAAIATGTATMLEDDADQPTPIVIPSAAVHKPAASKPAPVTHRVTPGRAHKKKAAAKARTHAKRDAATGRSPASAGTSAPAAAPAAPARDTTAPETTGATSKPNVKDTVDTVRDTTAPVTDALPDPVQQPVQQTLDTVQDTVGDVTDAVGGVLPK